MRHHEEHQNTVSPHWPCKLAIGSRQHAVPFQVFAVGDNNKERHSSRMIRKMHDLMMSPDLSVFHHWLQPGVGRG
jgi:hypothetical protein